MKLTTLRNLVDNSRFWTLVSGFIMSFVILGLVDQVIASDDLRTIRVEQIYGFISLFLLLLVLLIAPVYKVFPNLAYKTIIQYNRRPLGVLTFYYGLLHTLISFFGQLDGFSGIAYLNQTYGLSLLAGTLALMILLAMSLTSADIAIKKMGFPRWKALQRLVYIALILILLHVVLIGTHYVHDKNILFYATIFLVGLFLLFKYVLARFKK